MENKHHYQIRHPVMSVPQYMHLEPSLGMDFLQIPWNELRIKEFLGSGNNLNSAGSYAFRSHDIE